MIETFLEMYYFKSFIDAFAAVYGAREYKVFKPSPQREAWLGFDQAWAKTDLDEDRFFETISEYNHEGIPVDRRIIYAFYLQYKVVQIVKRGRIINHPLNFVNPYYKVPISLVPNRHNDLSQHQCLVKLSALPNSVVYYVCPMLFPPVDLYANPDINLLRFAEVDSNMHAFPNNTPHSINFQSLVSQPVWKSDSIEGKSLNFNSFSEKQFRIFNEETLKTYLIECKNILVENSKKYKESKLCKILPSSLIIISLNLPKKEKNEFDPFDEEFWSS